VALSGRTRSTRGLVIILCTLSLITITIDYRQGDNGPLHRLGSSIALSVIAPLQDAVTHVTRPIASFFSGVVKVPSLQAKITELRHQLAEAKAKELSTLSLQQQVRRLQAQLDMKQTIGLQHTTGARVISSGVSNFEWSVDIDKGSSSGIRPGMAVVADGALVGTVTDVAPFASKVTLILDPGIKVAGRLATSQVTGMVVGQGNHDLHMEFVDASTPVKVGEPVETVGFQGTLYPPGVPIGQVSTVSTDRVTGNKDITIRPTVDFSALDFVLVVLSVGTR
jgi:rod shape-determining protein MreC